MYTGISILASPALSVYTQTPTVDPPKCRFFPAELTDRQREVVQLAAEGHSVKEIAAILAISRKTVAFHKANVMRRLGIRSTAELTKYALEHGISGS
jgi:DNA-binding NarL/FixJ family response regulator